MCAGKRASSRGRGAGGGRPIGRKDDYEGNKSSNSDSWIAHYDADMVFLAVHAFEGSERGQAGVVPVLYLYTNELSDEHFGPVSEQREKVSSLVLFPGN